MTTEQKLKKDNKFIGFFKDFKSEFKRITYPSKEEVKKATITVVTFCLIYIMLIGIFDGAFNKIFELFLNKG